jgi:predicted DNA-binding transcriptional regulator YafY
MTDQYGTLIIMKQEKSFPRVSLPRIYFIDSRIASGAYPNTKALARKYEVSESTITRDIELMRDRLDAPIAYDALRRGYYYTEKTFRLPAVYTSASDLLALGMAKTLLTLYSNTPVHDAANRLLESITAPLNADGMAQWYTDRIVVPPVPSVTVSTEIWDSIITALRENRVITFEYSGALDDSDKPRRVRPYQLLFDNGNWLLYGYAEERKAIRIFFLSRMHSITVCPETFTLPHNFDYRLSNADDSFFGVFAGDKKQQFAIAFYDNSVRWVRERQWAKDQEIEETDDGVIIYFSSTQYNKVLEWVLSQGCTAEPLAPENLVAEWGRHAEAMNAMRVRKAGEA